MKKLLPAVVAAAAFCAPFAAQANPSLIGDTIIASGSYLSSSTATVGNGIEFTGIIGYINFDFGADTLTLTPASTTLSWGGFGTYTFTGFSTPISSFNIASNDGFFGTEITNYSFTPNSISIDMDYGYALYGTKLVYNIEVAKVPEPETFALLGIGLLGFALARRNKRG
jgi:hypothetical protein